MNDPNFQKEFSSYEEYAKWYNEYYYGSQKDTKQSQSNKYNESSNGYYQDQSVKAPTNNKQEYSNFGNNYYDPSNNSVGSNTQIKNPGITSNSHSTLPHQSANNYSARPNNSNIAYTDNHSNKTTPELNQSHVPNLYSQRMQQYADGRKFDSSAPLCSSSNQRNNHVQYNNNLSSNHVAVFGSAAPPPPPPPLPPSNSGNATNPKSSEVTHSSPNPAYTPIQQPANQTYQQGYTTVAYSYQPYPSQPQNYPYTPGYYGYNYETNYYAQQQQSNAINQIASHSNDPVAKAVAKNIVERPTVEKSSYSKRSNYAGRGGSCYICGDVTHWADKCTNKVKRNHEKNYGTDASQSENVNTSIIPKVEDNEKTTSYTNNFRSVNQNNTTSKHAGVNEKYGDSNSYGGVDKNRSPKISKDFTNRSQGFINSTFSNDRSHKERFEIVPERDTKKFDDNRYENLQSTNISNYGNATASSVSNYKAKIVKNLPNEGMDNYSYATIDDESSTAANISSAESVADKKSKFSMSFDVNFNLSKASKKATCVSPKIQSKPPAVLIGPRKGIRDSKSSLSKNENEKDMIEENSISESEMQTTNDSQLPSEDHQKLPSDDLGNTEMKSDDRLQNSENITKLEDQNESRVNEIHAQCTGTIITNLKKVESMPIINASESVSKEIHIEGESKDIVVANKTLEDNNCPVNEEMDIQIHEKESINFIYTDTQPLSDDGLTCYCCNIVVVYQSQMTFHLQTPDHLKAMISYNIDRTSSSDAANSRRLNPNEGTTAGQLLSMPPYIQNNGTTCTICDVSVNTSKLMTAHLNGSKHKKNLETNNKNLKTLGGLDLSAKGQITPVVPSGKIIKRGLTSSLPVVVGEKTLQPSSSLISSSLIHPHKVAGTIPLMSISPGKTMGINVKNESMQNLHKTNSSHFAMPLLVKNVDPKFVQPIGALVRQQHVAPMSTKSSRRRSKKKPKNQNSALSPMNMSCYPGLNVGNLPFSGTRSLLTGGNASPMGMKRV